MDLQGGNSHAARRPSSNSVGHTHGDRQVNFVKFVRGILTIPKYKATIQERSNNNAEWGFKKKSIRKKRDHVLVRRLGDFGRCAYPIEAVLGECRNRNFRDVRENTARSRDIRTVQGRPEASLAMNEKNEHSQRPAQACPSLRESEESSLLTVDVSRHTGSGYQQKIQTPSFDLKIPSFDTAPDEDKQLIRQDKSGTKVKLCEDKEDKKSVATMTTVLRKTIPIQSKDADLSKRYPIDAHNGHVICSDNPWKHKTTSSTFLMHTVRRRIVEAIRASINHERDKQCDLMSNTSPFDGLLGLRDQKTHGIGRSLCLELPHFSSARDMHGRNVPETDSRDEATVKFVSEVPRTRLSALATQQCSHNEKYPYIKDTQLNEDGNGCDLTNSLFSLQLQHHNSNSEMSGRFKLTASPWSPSSRCPQVVQSINQSQLSQQNSNQSQPSQQNSNQSQPSQQNLNQSQPSQQNSNQSQPYQQKIRQSQPLSRISANPNRLSCQRHKTDDFHVNCNSFSYTRRRNHGLSCHPRSSSSSSSNNNNNNNKNSNSIKSNCNYSSTRDHTNSSNAR